MSTSTKAAPKPKRPLSGYNLFYRYKRLKVVEATARRDIDGDDHRTRAVMHGVLTALPGLEDVPPVFPLFDLPQERLEEFRAANIRKAMEGKLFPNEHARKRVHCKVHGMGFVEMGRVMRQMWAQADKLTKDVFCELADVGRVRYRRLAAEYRLGGERPESVKSETPDCEVHKSAKAAAAVDPMATEATAKAETSETPSIPQQVGSSSDAMLEAPSVLATKNTPVAGAASSESNKGSRTSCGRRVSMDPYTLVPSEAQSYGRDLSEPLVVTSTANMSTAARLDLCDDSLFEPLPVERPLSTSNMHGRRFSTDVAPRPNWRATTGDGGWAPKMSGGRRVSTDVFPILNGSMGNVGAPAAVAMGKGNSGSCFARANLEGSKTNPELQQMFLSNTIKNLNDNIVQNNSLLPSSMRVFPEGGIAPQALPHPEIMTSGGPSILSSHGVAHNNANPGGGGNGPEKRRASARGRLESNYEPDEDFIKLINDLDKVIDDHGIAVGATREKVNLASGIADGAHDGGPSSIFCKPTFDAPGRDFGDKPVPPGQTVPMPAGIRLKNQGARMA